MNEHLVVLIGKTAGLSYRQTVVHKSHRRFFRTFTIWIHHDNICQIQVCRARRTNTVLRTFHDDGVSGLTTYMTPVRRVTVLVHQTDLGHVLIGKIHTFGNIDRCTAGPNGLTLYIQHMTTRSIVRIKRKYATIIRALRDGRREGVNELVILYLRIERIEWFYMIGLTDKRYLQARIVHRLELTPLTFETVCRSTRLQR